MICRHRTLGESLASKYRQSDVIIRTTDDEVGSHLLGSLHAVGFQVFCQHRRRHVHSQHDIDTLHRLVLP